MQTKKAAQLDSLFCLDFISFSFGEEWHHRTSAESISTTNSKFCKQGKFLSSLSELVPIRPLPTYTPSTME
jgi:hypothetical protein